MNEISLIVIGCMLAVSLFLLMLLCVQDFEAVACWSVLISILLVFSVLLVPFWLQYEFVFGQYDSIQEDLRNPYCSVSKDRIQEFNASLYSHQEDYQNGKTFTRFIFGDDLMELEFIEAGE